MPAQIAGRYDRSAVMKKAHREFAASRRRGDGWTFSRCLAFAWAIARARRARAELAMAA